MKYIKNDCTNPYYNLAFEEYVVRNCKDDDYVLLWQNHNTVVVGKHQNTLKEINAKAVEDLGVRVVRRNTGGGAVYHDMGNINFSYITDWREEELVSYERFLQPVIGALASFGVQAAQTGRNDLEVSGKKISGSAQAIIGGRILHHGTLLLNSELAMMEKVLAVDNGKIKSKGINSVAARVGNIQEFADRRLQAHDVMDVLLQAFGEDTAFQTVELTAKQLEEAGKLQKGKYETWDWNYGFSPDANFRNSARFPAGKIEVEMGIQEGFIRNCRIWGDFLGLYGVERIERALEGTPCARGDICRVLAQFDLRNYFGDITIEELRECFV